MGYIFERQFNLYDEASSPKKSNEIECYAGIALIELSSY
jgi:hypothetical protein